MLYISKNNFCTITHLLKYLFCFLLLLTTFKLHSSSSIDELKQYNELIQQKVNDGQYISAYLNIQDRLLDPTNSDDEKAYYFLIKSNFHSYLYDDRNAFLLLDSAKKYVKNEIIDEFINLRLAMFYFNQTNFKKCEELTNKILSNKTKELSPKSEGILLLQIAAIESRKKNFDISRNIINTVESKFITQRDCDYPLVNIAKLRIMIHSSDSLGLKKLVDLTERSIDSCDIPKYSILFKEFHATVLKKLGDFENQALLRLQSKRLKNELHKNVPLPSVTNIVFKAELEREKQLLVEKEKALNKLTIIFVLLGIIISIILFKIFKKFF